MVHAMIIGVCGPYNNGLGRTHQHTRSREVTRTVAPVGNQKKNKRQEATSAGGVVSETVKLDMHGNIPDGFDRYK